MKKTAADLKRFYFLLGVLLIILVLCTRIFGIRHEINNHPDEHVLVHSSVSMANVILGTEESLSEIKPYPEGSYFFYAPFQLINALLNTKFTGTEVQRAGAVFYYIVGGLAGLQFTRRFFKSKSAALIYVLICVFSIFHIEQSRYATGDAISFALLMLSMYFTARSLESSKPIYMYISFCLVGFAAAVKYPLIYFALMPICAVIRSTKGKPKRRLVQLLLGIIIMVASFLLLSPGVVKDIGYLIWTVKRETKAYMLQADLSEAGGIANHFLSVFLHWFLYSDILFSPILFVLGIRCFRKNQGEEKKNALPVFITIILPAVLGGFLLYNLFVTALFMRTLYPFFVMILPYVAYGCSIVLKKKRVIAVLLIAVLVVRGCMLTAFMAPPSKQDHLEDCIQKAISISGGKRVIALATDYITDGHFEALDNAEIISIDELRAEGFPEVESGDVIVTGALEFAASAPYIFPIKNEYLNRAIDGWKEFKEQHAEYYVGQSYPQYYGWLFGFWIRGSNLSRFDFPTSYVYAIPPEE